MNKQLICIACPRGCRLTVSSETAAGKQTVSVTGNFCPKGLEYGRQEAICPMRILTTTIACSAGGRIPVKTAKEIPLADVPRYMSAIRKLAPKAKANSGEIVAKNLLESDVDLIATGSASESYDYRAVLARST